MFRNLFWLLLLLVQPWRPCHGWTSSGLWVSGHWGAWLLARDFIQGHVSRIYSVTFGLWWIENGVMHKGKPPQNTENEDE